jgi:putative transposase
VAKRINGILKQEFLIRKHSQDLKIMKCIVKEAVNTCNQQRPHYSNYMLTPNEMYSHNQIKMRTYRTKNSSKLLLTTV